MGFGPRSEITCGVCVPPTSWSVLLSEHIWYGWSCLINGPDETWQTTFGCVWVCGKARTSCLSPSRESGTGREPGHIPTGPWAGFLAQAARHSHHRNCGVGVSISPLCAEATQHQCQPLCWEGYSSGLPFQRYYFKVAFSTGMIFPSLWSQQLEKSFLKIFLFDKAFFSSDIGPSHFGVILFLSVIEWWWFS